MHLCHSFSTIGTNDNNIWILSTHSDIICVFAFYEFFIYKFFFLVVHVSKVVEVEENFSLKVLSTILLNSLLKYFT